MQYVSTCWRETLRVLHCNYPTDVLWVIDCIVIAIELLLNYLYGILYFIKVIIVQQIIGNVSKSNHHDIFLLGCLMHISKQAFAVSQTITEFLRPYFICCRSLLILFWRCQVRKLGSFWYQHLYQNSCMVGLD